MRKDEVLYGAVLSFVTGVASGSFFEVKAVSLILLGAAFLLALSVVFRSRTLFWWCVFILLCMGGAQPAWEKRLVYASLPEYREVVSGSGRIVSDPEEHDLFQKIVVHLEQCESRACPAADTLWQAPLSFHGEAGTRLFFSCHIERPKNFTPDFDYQMFLAKDGIGFVCLKAEEVTVLEPDWSSTLRATLYAPKHALEQALSQILTEPEAGLAKGLLLGGDSYLPRTLKESFTRVGLSHMIAVSGYNITIIAQMLLTLGLAFGLWRKHSIWFVLVGIIFFIIMIGAPASAARAGAMAGIVFVALQLGRLAYPVRTLTFALGVMLFLNPLLLRYDLGFQLSFLATLGILSLMPYYERFAPKQWLLKKGGEILFMTFAVELFVLPLILYSFATFSPLIMIGNFLVILVPFAMAASFVAALLFLLLPGAHLGVAWAAYGLLTGITRAVEWLGSFPEASITVASFGIWPLCLWYAILGIFTVALARVLPPQTYEKNI